jgi:hypothetical protein
MCTGKYYNFSAWVKRPNKRSFCTAQFNVGDNMVGFTNKQVGTDYEHVTGVVAPVANAQQTLTILVQCQGTPNDKGNMDIYIDQVTVVQQKK